MYSIGLPVPARAQAQTGIIRCIERAAERPEIQRRLRETAVVIEPHVTNQSQAGFAVQDGPFQRRGRYASHYLIGDDTPFGRESRAAVSARKIVNWLAHRDSVAEPDIRV